MAGEKKKEKDLMRNIALSDDDIFEAMKEMRGYLDITPGDLREVFGIAYRHAMKRLYYSVKAADIMTSPVHVAKTDTPLVDAAYLMAEKKVSGLPVLNSAGAVAGVISERDYLSHMGQKGISHVMEVLAECLGGSSCSAAAIRSQTAKDIMSSPAVTVKASAPVFDIMMLFSNLKINRVPVVGEKGELLGIVSRADIMRATYGL